MDIFLIVAALVPGIVLLSYVYKKDRAEKEPLGLLLLLLGLGALSCYPAGMIEGFLLDGIIAPFFSGFGTSYGDTVIVSDFTYRIYQLCENFIGIALVEEGLKWLILYFVTRKNKNFNSLFDGLIYAVFVSLGFAILENVMYVLNYGFETALLRAVTAVPGHMFDGVIMGYYYTVWRSSHIASIIENHFVENGLVAAAKRKFFPRHYLVLSLVMPVLAHGFYDFCCSVEAWWATAVFYIFLIGLYIYCFSKIKKLSKQDMNGVHFSIIWFNKNYPQFSEELKAFIAPEKREQTAGQGS